MTIYLLGLMILMVEGWGLKPLGYLSPDVYLVLTLGYLLFSYVLFPERKFTYFSKQMIPFWLVIIGIVLSVIPAWIFHNQSILQSIISYRAQFLWLVVPILLRLRPTLREVNHSCLIFTVALLILTILHSFMPSLFVHSQEEMEKIMAQEEAGMYLLRGFSIPVIPLAIALQKLGQRFEMLDLLIVAFCFFCLFVQENRTSLFASIFMVGLMFLYSKYKYRYVVMVAMGVLAGIFVWSTISTWMALIEETIMQVGDADYNRNKAMLYFLSPLANPSWATYIFGNGFLSAHASQLMATMMAEGVYNSDVGYVGFWNQFGLLPIVGFLIVIVKGFSGKDSTLIHKMLSLYLIMTSITIGYYASATHLVFFVLAYYLIMHKKRKILIAIRPQAAQQCQDGEKK